MRRMAEWKWLQILLVVTACAAKTSEEPPPSCSSLIYCQGSLLDTIQGANIYSDSKTFVDMRLLKSPDLTLSEFDAMMARTTNAPTRADLEDFLLTHFVEGDELVEWSPPDFKSDPQFINGIEDPSFKQFAKDLVSIWPTLGRKAVQDVADRPEMYSFVYIPNGFIIPGGRFKEIYYWDTYWIVMGLLESEMSETVRGILENFLHLVKTMGHIPNGSRVYYAERSQPPLLMAMAKAYLDVTGNWLWLKENISTLEKELNFWLENRSVTVALGRQKYSMLRYNAESLGPRPESYEEDAIAAENISESDKQRFYSDLKSAAESGWDFSTRWFIRDGGCQGGCNLTDIHTSSIIPVDLNAIFANACKTLSAFYGKLGDRVNEKKWMYYAIRHTIAIQRVLWNEEDGIWYDYDLTNKVQRNKFYPSNVFPLWMKTIPNEEDLALFGSRVLNYLETVGALSYPGGIPTSLFESGQQWDMPNAWAPLQAVVIMGLHDSGNHKARDTATNLAQTWLRANHIGYTNFTEMFEKYDANVPGQFGGGGEYIVQAGFGWTNGLAIQLLSKFAKTVTAS